MNVLVDGQLINYSDEGEGKVIVLLHGWGSKYSTFDDIALHLKKKFRVIRLDFPGFGASPKPSDVWGVSDYANLTSQFLKKIKASDVYAIIGHSFGGRVIIKGIAEELLSAEKVILMDAAGLKPSKTVRKSLYTSIAKIGKATTSLPLLKTLRPVLRKKLYSAIGSTDYLNANEMQQIFLNTISEDLMQYVHHITQPTLLLWGQNDTETPVSDAQKMLRELNKGKLAIIPNAGHFVYVDAFDQVTQELDRFL
ncbi:alpha/beta hydrolase [soil metagenome]